MTDGTEMNMVGGKTGPAHAPVLLVVQNSAEAPPGLLGERIARRGWRMDLVCPHDRQDEPGFGLPASIQGYDALVVLGGLQDAWDEERYPALAGIVTLLRRFLDTGRPILGICLGGQLLARALGAPVRRMAAGYERGLIPMTPPPGASPSILPPGPLRLASWHQDSFDLPQGAELLLSSDSCRHQVFRAGDKVYGFQCHIEATPAIVMGWADRPEDRDPEAARALRARIEAESAQYFQQTMADSVRIIENWLNLIAPA